MTTRIANTLHETAEAVEVPPIDQIAFQQRVRAARRRRTAVRATVAVAASVALAAGVGVVGQWRASDEAGAPANPGERASFEPMQTLVPFVANDNLMVILPSGTPVSTGLEVEDIVGQVSDGVIVVGPDSRILQVSLDAAGRPSRPTQPIVGNDPVEQAVLSKDGSTIGWIDPANRLHLRRLAEPREFHTEQLAPEARLISVAADAWVILPDEGKSLRLATMEASVELRSQAEPSEGELAGGTIAAEGHERVEFFAATGGPPLSMGTVGADEGALSPDGSTYAAATIHEDEVSGVSTELAIVDVQTGKRTAIPAPDGMHLTYRVVWNGTNFLVSASGGKHERIFECSAQARACRVLHTGPRGDLLGLARN